MIQGMTILVIDDDKSVRSATTATIRGGGHDCHSAANSQEAFESLGENSYDVVLLDLKLGKESGLDILERIHDQWPELPVVVFTAYSTVDTAVEAMRRGASDYLQKPFEQEHLRQVIQKVDHIRRLENRVTNLEGRISSENPVLQMQSDDAAMQEVLRIADKAAPSVANVLILGESGSGKSVLARYLHESGPLKDRAFITVNCPCLSRELLESELFGHVKGSFTGAYKDAQGKVAAAHGGTLFLDEIGELPLEIQPKLLRLVQEKSYERIGENRTRRANVRIIAATNCDLQKAVEDGTFREDLYFRLNVLTLEMPPLRERPRDLESLTHNFLQFFGSQGQKGVTGIEEAALRALRQYSWPGNLRELRNILERAVILSEGKKLTLRDLPENVRNPAPAETSGGSGGGVLEVGADLSLEQMELEHIRRVVNRSRTLEEAAKILEIDPATLYRKRKKLANMGS